MAMFSTETPEEPLFTITCGLCSAERPADAMMIELINGELTWICGGTDPVTGADTITDCEIRRGI